MKVQRRAFKFDQGTEMKSESGERRASACESDMVRKKWKVLKQGPFATETGKRDESTELRGSTFSLAFVLAFAVVSR